MVDTNIDTTTFPKSFPKCQNKRNTPEKPKKCWNFLKENLENSNKNSTISDGES
jgi:hypothetical protein